MLWSTTLADVKPLLVEMDVALEAIKVVPAAEAITDPLQRAFQTSYLPRQQQEAAPGIVRKVDL